MSASEVKTVPPPGGGDLNLAILNPIFGWIEKTHGREALSRVVEASGLEADAAANPKRWILLSQFENILTSVRELAGSDAEFMKACAYDMVKFYGPLALVFRAATPLTSYGLLARTVHFASRISSYEIANSSPRSVTLRYRSTKAESRLMCLSRQAQLPMPLLFWKLAPSTFTESKCIARGDDCCEYRIRWSEPLPWRLPLLGAFIGALGAGVASFAHAPAHAGWTFAFIGTCIGATLAFRNQLKQAHAFHMETTEAVGVAVKEHQEAVEDIIKLHHRQEAFNSLLAERIDARTATLEAMVNELKSRDARSEVALKTATHDMRNPLQVALLNAQALESENDPEVRAIAKLIQDSVLSVEAQMKRLLAIAQAADKAFEIHNKPMDVERFTERVRRNLQALVIARDIRTSTFRTREGPDSIETDVMLFDRVIDNLISNAVKYTERGSIVAEVGGTPGHLTFKISDTGRGISPERLEKVFVGGQRDARPLLGESHGIGLSSAIRLLDEIGGRLEVMSKPGVGTTIWAHVPIEPPKRGKGLRSIDAGEVLRRVVTIRQAANQ
ncbi:MAG TPA: ATP-binding protein [Polyangiaceae bacterium]|jgi:signal transduction histidine kinase